MEVSPLFAMHASKLLDKGELEEAIQLCEQGLSKWPDYMVAYTIVAKGHLGLDSPQMALQAINKGLERFPREHSLIELRLLAVAMLNGVPEDETADIKVSDEILDMLEGADTQEAEPADTPSDDDLEEQPVEVDHIRDELEQDEEEVVEQDVNSSFSEPEVLAKDLEDEVPDEESEPTPPPAPLRLVESVPSHDASAEFNSGDVRLIPGLEYHSLSIGSSQQASHVLQRVQAPEPPGFPTIQIDEVLQQPVKKLTPLEELARRLGAKTVEPVVAAEETSSNISEPTPGIAMTETIANIYAMQGAWQEVITAYEALKKKHPDKVAEYDKRIAEAKEKL